MKIIVAFDKNRLIGNQGNIPWKNKEDMQYFKEITTNNVVIMGRKTYESINSKPLKNRINIILSSRDFTKNYENEFFVKSKEEAVEKTKEYKDKEIFIIGGAEIYNLFLNDVKEVYASIIPGEYSGDTYFPEFKSEIIEHKKFNTFDFFKFKNGI